MEFHTQYGFLVYNLKAKVHLHKLLNNKFSSWNFILSVDKLVLVPNLKT